MIASTLQEAIDPQAVGILKQIAEERIRRIQATGAYQGVPLPAERALPLVPFLRDPAIICEVKRASPSAGAIAEGLDPVEQAIRYADAGVPSVSILTEEARFRGSLSDLHQVKAARPDLAILRKDFLLSEEDLEISYRAGADAVLLIAALLTEPVLERLYRHATGLGLEALVEVHDEADLDKARRFKPPLLGMNSRDLGTFAVDPLLPLGLIGSVDWPCRVVYESGISRGEHIRLAGAGGFSGALVGEAVVRKPELLPEFVDAAEEHFPGGRESGRFFWRRLAGRLPASSASGGERAWRPLVKICGITRVEDARLAAELGADILGFVFADSPRRAEPELLRQLRDLPVLKVGVVVTQAPEGPKSGPGARGATEGRDPGARTLPPGVEALLREGLLDAVQFHGEEGPEECAAVAFPYYKALRVRDPRELAAARRYGSPRVLLDHYDPKLAGGTGKRIDAAVLSSEELPKPVWLAGGLSPENIREAIETYHPELVDASSRLEAEPGRKDPEKLKRFFVEVQHATSL